MADISTEIAAIQAASRGEAVRDSIVSALDKCNSNTSITVDSAPTQGSNHAVSSGGVYTALQNVSVTVDSAPTSGSNNPVSSGGVYTALQNVQPNIPLSAGIGTDSLQQSGSWANGDYSAAFGYDSSANGHRSHAEGYYTEANGDMSHAEGYGTIAHGYCQHVFGIANSEDLNDAYVEIVGNGAATGDLDFDRSNARTLDWSGNEVLAGKLTVGAQAVNANDVPTLAQVQALIAAALQQ